MEIKEILGSKMYLDKGDNGISDQLIEHGIRETASTWFIKNYLKKDHVIIDIGANIGYYALLEAKLSGFVYAVEPIKESLELLNKSIKANDYKNIRTYNFAIGSQIKKEYINLSRRSNWCSMMDIENTPGKYQERFNRFMLGKREITVLTLDHFVKEYVNGRHIDLIRIDVEGYEVEIVKSMEYAVSLMPVGGILSIEFHPVVYEDRNILVNTFDKIIEMGFKVVKITTHDESYKDISVKKWLLKKGACPQVFFKKV